MGARWYQPTTATFTARDTVFGELATPVSLNRYTYAANSPIAYFDPDGHRYLAVDDTNQETVEDRAISHEERRLSTRGETITAAKLNAAAARSAAEQSAWVAQRVADRMTAVVAHADEVGIAEVYRTRFNRAIVACGGDHECEAWVRATISNPHNSGCVAHLPPSQQATTCSGALVFDPYVDDVPFVDAFIELSGINDLACALTGTDLNTGLHVSTGERIWSGLASLPVGRLAKLAGIGNDTIRAAARLADELEAAEPAILVASSSIGLVFELRMSSATVWWAVLRAGLPKLSRWTPTEAEEPRSCTGTSDCIPRMPDPIQATTAHRPTTEPWRSPSEHPAQEFTISSIRDRSRPTRTP